MDSSIKIPMVDTHQRLINNISPKCFYPKTEELVFCSSWNLNESFFNNIQTFSNKINKTTKNGNQLIISLLIFHIVTLSNSLLSWEKSHSTAHEHFSQPPKSLIQILGENVTKLVFFTDLSQFYLECSICWKSHDVWSHSSRWAKVVPCVLRLVRLNVLNLPIFNFT